MRVLVVGGNGFIGSHIVDRLLSRGDEVRVFDRQRELFRPGLKGVDYVYADFEDAAALEDALKGIDIVVHLVGTTIPQTSNMNPVFDVQSNVIGSLSLLEGCRRTGVNKLVFLSSGGTVYGIPRQLPITESHPTDPICSYGITKLAVEKYIALYSYLYGIRYAVLRSANPYGERQNPENRQGAVSVFLAKASKNEEIVIWGDGEVARDFFYISDLVDACTAVMDREDATGIYNIGSGVQLSLNRLLEVIGDATGSQLRVSYTQTRKLDVPVNVLDITRAKAELGWSPRVDLVTGIKRTWDWILTDYPKSGN